MQSQTFTISLLVILSLAVANMAWPDLYDNEFKRWSLKRRSFDKCQGSGGKCYSTEDCCSSFVCAAFDDIAGMSPTDPGWCVHEKELEPCMSKFDCSPPKQCMPLAGGNTYCVPIPDGLADENNYNSASHSTGKGGIGQTCKSSSDCKVYGADGKSKLCCQKIRRGRQGTVQKCDVIKPISMCIN